MVDSKDPPAKEDVVDASNDAEEPDSSSTEDSSPSSIGKSKHKPLTDTESQLMAEIQNGDVDKVVSLLAAGADVNCLDNHGMTPLMQAAHKGRF